MNVGILKERFEDEQRVALSPFGVESIVRCGAKVIVEEGAGVHARFTDEQYRQAGATIIYSPEEVAGRADLLLKVMPPLRDEYKYLVEGQTLMSFLLLGMGRKVFFESLLVRNITAVGLEYLQTPDGGFPILRLMSEISGQVAALVASRYLRSDQGGRGVLLGGLAGIAPAAVVILGGGATGFSAAQSAIGLGAQVIVLDKSMDRLREFDLYFAKRVTTVIATLENIRRGIQIADVFIGAITIDDDESHHLITEEMVKTMKPGAVIIDISINQGGCVETSHPTTIRDPVYMKHGVIHYCVPNMPSVVARTSTYAMTNGILPLVQRICAEGIAGALANDPMLRSGVVTHRGTAAHRVAEELYNLPFQPL